MEGFITSIQNNDNAYIATIIIAKPVNSAKNGSAEWKKIEENGIRLMQSLTLGKVKIEYT